MVCVLMLVGVGWGGCGDGMLRIGVDGGLNRCRWKWQHNGSSSWHPVTFMPRSPTTTPLLEPADPHGDGGGVEACAAQEPWHVMLSARAKTCAVRSNCEGKKAHTHTQHARMQSRPHRRKVEEGGERHRRHPPDTSMVASMSTVATASAVFMSRTSVPSSRPVLWATSMVSSMPNQLQKKEPATEGAGVGAELSKLGTQSKRRREGGPSSWCMSDCARRFAPPVCVCTLAAVCPSLTCCDAQAAHPVDDPAEDGGHEAVHGDLGVRRR